MVYIFLLVFLLNIATTSGGVKHGNFTKNFNIVGAEVVMKGKS